MKTRIKHSLLVASTYDALLSLRCRRVQAYVFVATTGRSGSESLSAMLKAVRGSVCYHEPYPVMYNDCPPGVDAQRYCHERFQRIKRINIKRAAIGHRYYVETNHQFAKRFLPEAVACFGNKIRIIHLVRDAAQVAASFYAVGSVPGVTDQGKLYLLDPLANDNRIQIGDLLSSDAELGHDFYKCLWYWYEMEVRIREWKRLYPHVNWVRIETRELNDTEAMRDALDRLGLGADPQELGAVVGLRLNSKTEQKTRALAMTECRDMQERFLHRVTERYGHDLST